MFVNGISSLNAQAISLKENEFFDAIHSYDNKILPVCFSEFKTYIKPAAMRRMSSSVKMGVVGAMQAMQQATVSQPDAIIIGTGMGCKTDSDLFLEELLTSNEGLLSPTKFIQSTHNTVGGQIALQLQCKAYNMTYVQGAASFESALLDAFLEAKTSIDKNFLVGGVDEISKYSQEFHKLDGQLKQEEKVHNLNLLDYVSTGTINGEGASFFVTSDQKKENTFASVKDIHICNHIALNDLKKEMISFLDRNHLNVKDIDAVILGNNGDVNFDSYYHILQKEVFEEVAQVYYKHLIGEYYTSSGFALWLACKILKLQKIPKVCSLKSTPSTSIKRMVLYNQYKGRDHSFILLETC